MTSSTTPMKPKYSAFTAVQVAQGVLLGFAGFMAALFIDQVRGVPILAKIRPESSVARGVEASAAWPSVVVAALGAAAAFAIVMALAKILRGRTQRTARKLAWMYLDDLAGAIAVTSGVALALALRRSAASLAVCVVLIVASTWLKALTKARIDAIRQSDQHSAPPDAGCTHANAPSP